MRLKLKCVQPARLSLADPGCISLSTSSVTKASEKPAVLLALQMYCPESCCAARGMTRVLFITLCCQGSGARSLDQWMLGAGSPAGTGAGWSHPLARLWWPAARHGPPPKRGSHARLQHTRSLQGAGMEMDRQRGQGWGQMHRQTHCRGACMGMRRWIKGWDLAQPALTYPWQSSAVWLSLRPPPSA